MATPEDQPLRGDGRWVRRVVLVWLGWAVLMLGFQAWVQARYELKRPDTVKDWTASWTNAGSASRHPYLQAQAMKGHAAWDSEFYISIALHGYEDPAMRAASPGSTPDAEVAAPKGTHPTWVSLNHAFFPGYPFAMGLIARPLAAGGMAPVDAATLAGVIVSIIAALFAMLAIADLAHAGSRTDEDPGGNALTAAFYLAIWPAAVFLAQVYSESLFLALSFGALAMLKRDRWGFATALAVGAVFTRATGLLLVIPFGLAWLGDGERRSVPRAVLAASPLLAYLAWRLFFGADFDFVETKYFGRWPLALGQSLDAWSDFLDTLMNGEAPARAYDLVELAGIAASLVTSAMLWPRDKALTLYGLATFAVVATSGAALGMHRYALAMPSMFMAPAFVGGRHPVFDRIWTLACVLGLAALTLAFSFGFWAG
jgi:Mannosyltransferase (PIG-V)